MSAVLVKDGIWKKVKRDVAGFADIEVFVGIPEGTKEHDGISTAEVGVINHYGTDTIPARPFLSTPLDGRRSEVKAIMARIAKLVLRNDGTAPVALRALGEWSRNEVLKGIAARQYEPNAERTIQGKRGGDTPLVNFGTLKGAITYLIRGKTT